MSDRIQTTGNGLGVCTVLAIVFTTLKLTDHIDWSWWWVLSPLWVPWAIVGTILGAMALFSIVVFWVKS